jgi:small subunit ribosomal protein S21
VINIKEKRMNHYPKISVFDKQGVGVRRRKDESNEELLKRFRKKFSKSGIIRELKESMYYEKPSDKRRRKKAQAIRNLKREEEKLAKLIEKAAKRKFKKRKGEKKYAVSKSRTRQNRSENGNRGSDKGRDSNS